MLEAWKVHHMSYDACEQKSSDLHVLLDRPDFFCSTLWILERFFSSILISDLSFSFPKWELERTISCMSYKACEKNPLICMCWMDITYSAEKLLE